ncbi:MAG: ferrochelatase [Gemmataceae bacterium]|nr:ferrochelatase [Gemmataceae bacterium]
MDQLGIATDAASTHASTGILLIQLGTPDAPTPKALRRYLRQFLGDPRVIEAPRWLWWIILNLVVLPFRPRRSAEKYQRIWDPETGSPLMHLTMRQTELLQRCWPHLPVRFGMQYGQPSVASVVREMIGAGVNRLIVVPMYPQYSATTYAAATDALFKALLKERRVPAIRIVPPFFDHPAYIEAQAAVIERQLAGLDWEPEHFVLSFHGIPLKYAQRGDPYPQHVDATVRRLTERLGWTPDRFTRSYQSLFGRDEWLRPYTDDVLQELARRGIKRVFVVTPGFTTDCLETVDEIGHESAEIFREAGGERLHQCACLNDSPEWIAALQTIIAEESQGWLDAPATTSRGAAATPSLVG